MTRTSRRENRAARRRREAQPPSTAARRPRLVIDFAIAALLLCSLAYDARAWLNPDGVAYLENAEALARGHWSAAIQGYWSPGYSILLAPLARAAGDDRALLLGMVHLLQAFVGIGALWLAVLAARRRVPDALQRVAFWCAAWTVIVLLSQELVTPDLLLCVCLLAATVLLDQPDRRAQVTMGILVGIAFLLKTSIWPWLCVAALLAVRPAWRLRSWSAVPWRALAPAAVLIGSWLVVLGIQAGRPTLGSVGPLNFGWYFGDDSRRTPDMDLGPHALSRQVSLPTGAKVTFTDLRGAGETYLPWSNPERWARGIPAGAEPRLSLRRTGLNGYANLKYAAVWVLPVALGLAVCVLLSGVPGQRAPLAQWVGDRSLMITGLVAMAVSLVLHPEHRLIAPAVLLCAFGALASARAARPTAPLRVVGALFVAGLLISTGGFLAPRHQQYTQSAERKRTQRADLDKYLASTPGRGAVILGQATPWMGLLWVEHMRVVIQFGAAGSAAVQALAEPQRVQWLHDNFGRDAIAWFAIDNDGADILWNIGTL